MQSVQSSASHLIANSSQFIKTATTPGTTVAPAAVQEATGDKYIKADLVQSTDSQSAIGLPQLAPTAVPETLENAQRVADFLQQNGLDDSAQSVSQTNQLIQQEIANNALFGLSATPDQNIVNFCNLIRASQKLESAASNQKTNAVSLSFKASFNMAEQQREQGASALRGAIWSGVTSSGLSILGAASSIRGTQLEVKAQAITPGLNLAAANNPGSDAAQATAAAANANIISGKTGQITGDLLQRGIAPAAQGALHGNFELEQTGHQKEATELGAVASVYTNLVEQHTQSTNKAAELAKQIQEMLKQYISTNQSAIDTSVSNMRI